MHLRPLSPLLRLTLAVASICGLLVLLADALLGAFPSRTEQTLALRRQMAEGLAAQSAVLLRANQADSLRSALEDAVARLPQARAAALRRADGQVLVQAGPSQALPATGAEPPSADHLTVPLMADGRAWGRLELAFAPDARPAWRRWLDEPLVATLLLVGLLGSALIGLYLRRALQHLDPAAVIPERVQGAFDVMNDGVAVLDTRGRVLLTNTAFRSLCPDGGGVRVGQPLSTLAWLLPGLPQNPADHPWARTLADGQPVTGHTLALPEPGNTPRHLLVNTMPIQDGAGRVRGCVASFGDLSALHRSNQQLQQAMQALEQSRDEVQRQNQELQRLATSDPLTGALNRRAFNEAFHPAFELARRNGSPLACLVLDIDHFKRVNDSHGHGVGDRVIQETARLLQATVRRMDLVCRYGGEEFVVLLVGLGADEAMALAEQVRQRMAAECGPAVHEVPGLLVTASIGVATLDAHLHLPGLLVDQADQALYLAKRQGRNQVCLARPAAALRHHVPA